MRYWLGVVSKEHVQKGMEGGFAQVCHGKKGPLMKMVTGDGFVYYSPRVSLFGKDLCKCFTAIGTIKTGKVYQVEMTPDFHPYRIDIDYFPSQDVPITDLMDQLELTQHKSWGMQLRRGLIEICPEDFSTISKAMQL
ncbi:MAG: EVE domain-containing protein [Simkania sp.]|nr:EVE domain-containing protein [Simkania sp.]MCP5490846.1 EVE domain-containing protein [Chlamydiales bacterium]